MCKDLCTKELTVEELKQVHAIQLCIAELGCVCWCPDVTIGCERRVHLLWHDTCENGLEAGNAMCDCGNGSDGGLILCFGRRWMSPGDSSAPPL